MMTFEEFTTEFAARIREQLGVEYNVEVQEILKNNSTKQTQLVIQKKSRRTGASFDIHNSYEQYVDVSEPNQMDKLAGAIILQYLQQYDNVNAVENLAEGWNDYQNVKDKILFKLVSTKHNEELLNQIPNVPYLDLSIVFYICLSEDEDNGMMVTIIKNEHMEYWNITKDELYRAAKENTPEKQPLVFKSMREVISEMFGGPEMEKEVRADLDQMLEDSQGGAPELYVLSNHSGINGASVILYPGALKKYADLFQSDLIVLPSSVHEVLITPYRKNMDTQEMSELVEQINLNEVSREDWLSDHAYRYYHQENQLVAV